MSSSLYTAVDSGNNPGVDAVEAQRIQVTRSAQVALAADSGQTLDMSSTPALQHVHNDNGQLLDVSAQEEVAAAEATPVVTPAVSEAATLTSVTGPPVQLMQSTDLSSEPSSESPDSSVDLMGVRDWVEGAASEAGDAISEAKDAISGAAKKIQAKVKGTPTLSSTTPVSTTSPSSGIAAVAAMQSSQSDTSRSAPHTASVASANDVGGIFLSSPCLYCHS